MNFKNLLSNFVEFESDKKKDDESSSATTQTSEIPGIPGGATIAPISVVSPYAVPPSTTSTLADQNLVANFSQKIQAAFASSSLASVVTNFTETMEGLKELNPDEGTRFRTAMKVLKLTPVVLRQAFESLLAVVDKEQAAFQNTLDLQRKNEIGRREAEVTTINSQVETLNKQIEALMMHRDKLGQEVVTMKTKLDTAENSFTGAATMLRGQITDSVRKLDIYAPPTGAATAKK